MYTLIFHDEDDDDHDYDCWLELYTHNVEIVSPTEPKTTLNSIQKVCNANIHKSIKGLSIKEVDDNDKTFFILIFF